MNHLSAIFIATALSFSFLSAQETQTEPLKGIEGKPAPPLGVSDWIQLPEGKDQLTLHDFKDKVVVMLLFQSTCEACQKREFPVLQELVKQFKGNEGVAFLAIQTPFENYASNSELRLKPTAEKFDLKIPFGHLAKTKDAYSINVAYETGGTPWWVIIDKEGKVEFNGFSINSEIATENIKKMIAGESLD